jgi:glycosyltransferase involved in cell wall biosynthesis
MRIGIDTTPLPARPVGAGNYIIQLVNALTRLDAELDEHELVIFAHRENRQAFDPAADDRVSWILTPHLSPVMRLLWEQVSLPRLARKQRLDLLHSLHYTRPLWLPCASVVTLHDMTFFLQPELHTRVKRFFFPRAIRYSARHATALIADSESTRQDAIRMLNIDPQKITTALLGATPNFHPISESELLTATRKKYNLPDDFILYVGLVEPRKNLPLLIRALASLRQQGYPIPLVIVGRFGWRHAAVLEQIEQLGLKEHVIFTGYVPQADLPILYNLASVFVYPTLYEGFGLPVLEAMACGAAVVTSAVSSLPEIVGDTGLLVPPGDEPALAQAIASLLSDQEMAARLSQAAQTRALEFSWKRTAQKTWQVYQSVLSTP